MFPTRYFTARFFPLRYFPKIGASGSGVPIISLDVTVTEKVTLTSKINKS